MHRSLRIRVGATVIALAFAGLHPRSAVAGPDDKLHNASDLFDAGAKAFKAKSFEEAASNFEAADDAVPSAKALRLAIRARAEAGQSARAATLSALALSLYGSDTETTKLAQDTVDKVAPSLQKVNVTCASACLLAAGTSPVHGQAATRWTIYLDPGKTTVGASFMGNVTAPEQRLFAAPGGSLDMKFEPPKDGAAVPVVPPPKTPDVVDQPPGESTPPKKHFGAHPALFFVGLAATVGLGATTIWSGIDTKNNPGVNKVKSECAGKGVTCPAYEEGLAHQTRTNVLIGVTAGTAAITLVIGAFLTNWHGKDKTDAPADSPTNPNETPADTKAELARRHKIATAPRLWVDVLGARDASTVGASPAGLAPGGGVMGLQGRF